MFDPKNPPADAALTGTASEADSLPAGRVMRVSPLDMRQPRFKPAFRGFDKTEVTTFLTEAADDYEYALREIDRLRQDLSRSEALLADHRERETNLRTTLATAQRLAEETKQAAQAEARMIVRDAQSRSDILIKNAHARRDEIDRDINEMRLRRRSVEASLEASIQSLDHALAFIRERDKRSEAEAHPHHPRQSDGTPG